MKKSILLAVFWGLLIVAAIDASYVCPYSGPAAYPNETQFQVETYLIDLSATFPTETDDGFIEGHCTLDCIAKVNALSTISLDFYSDDTVSVSAVTVNGTASSYSFANHLIAITLAAPLSINDAVSIDVSYRAQGLDHFKFLPKPPKTPKYAFNAMVEASRWFPCLHDPIDKALYEIRVTIPIAQLAACNGTLESDVDNGDGTHTMTWVEHSPMATYLATINISEYVTFGHTWNTIPVIYYVHPDSLTAAQTDFQNDDAILDYFDATFGPYPFEKMGLAQVKLPGAMENQDMISYGLISGDLANEDTFAHEISHMYWGNSVTLTGCEDVWLNEGFASYCEALWEEHFYGDAAYDTVMADFKQRYFDEDSKNRFSIYDPEDVWSNTTYRKGAWVLHMLRQVVGDSAFFNILPEYYDRYQFSHAITPEFRAVCEEIHGESLDWFFQQWIYQAGYPEFVLYSEYVDGTAHVFVEQIQDNAPIFKMPGTIQSNLGTTTETHTINLETGVDYVAIPMSSAPDDLVLDPNNDILCTTTYGINPPTTRCIITMPSDKITAGDTVWCRVYVDNFGHSPLTDNALFVILDVFGELFFAPSFAMDADYYGETPFYPGRTVVDVLPEFTWPENTGSASGILWYAALVSSDFTELFGEMDMFSFGWE